MRLTWSARRQLLYYSVALVVFAVVAWWGYNTFFTQVPTCFDGAQNQDERGVDCDGSCSLVCAADVRSPKVLWARAFEVAPGTYTAAAYIENPNITAGAKRVRYSFQLFDSNNSLVVEREGVADLPPVQNIPLVESNINTGNRTVARALFAFGNTPVWNKFTIPALRVTSQNLASDGSRLSATIVNGTTADARRTAITAVLFDKSGVARAASRSVIDVPKKGSTTVVFTWPLGTPNIVRAEITVLPSF